MQLHKTPLDEVFFRAHGVGALMTDGRGTVLTDKQAVILKDFESRLRSGGKLTPKQRETMVDYQKRRDAPPELSDTAKTFVQKTWLWHEKGFRKRIKSDYLEKGIFQETESMALLSELDGIFYAKNIAREFCKKTHLSGECDIKTKMNGGYYIDDIKSSWDAETFMNADWDKLKEWQGRSYLHLYGGDVFRLRFCLVDAPDHIVTKQKEKLWREFYSDSFSDEETHRMEESLKPMYEQIERNLVYSNNPQFTKEERVKTYTIERDDAKFKELQERIEPALKYYSELQLNRLVGKYSI